MSGSSRAGWRGPWLCPWLGPAQWLGTGRRRRTRRCSPDRASVGVGCDRGATDCHEPTGPLAGATPTPATSWFPLAPRIGLLQPVCPVPARVLVAQRHHLSRLREWADRPV